MKAVESLLREPPLLCLANWTAAKLFRKDCSEYEKLVRAWVEQSLIKNPDLNRVKTEWRAKQEEFLRKLEEEKKEATASN